MKNWKTTLTGVVLAVLYALVNVLQNGAGLDDWKTYAVPVALAVLGILAKDFDVTGGVKKIVPLLAVCLFMGGCATNYTKTTMPDGRVIEIKATSSDPAALAAVVELSNRIAPFVIHATK